MGTRGCGIFSRGKGREGKGRSLLPAGSLPRAPQSPARRGGARRGKRRGGGGGAKGPERAGGPGEKGGVRGLSPPAAALGCAEPRGAPGRGRATGPAEPGAPVLAPRPPERVSPYPALITPNPGGTFPAWLVFSCLVLFWKRKRLNPLQEPVSKSLFLKAIDCKSLI